MTSIKKTEKIAWEGLVAPSFNALREDEGWFLARVDDVWLDLSKNGTRTLRIGLTIQRNRLKPETTYTDALPVESYVKRAVEKLLGILAACGMPAKSDKDLPEWRDLGTILVGRRFAVRLERRHGDPKGYREAVEYMDAKEAMKRGLVGEKSEGARP